MLNKQYMVLFLGVKPVTSVLIAKKRWTNIVTNQTMQRKKHRHQLRLWHDYRTHVACSKTWEEPALQCCRRESKFGYGHELLLTLSHWSMVASASWGRPTAKKIFPLFFTRFSKVVPTTGLYKPKTIQHKLFFFSTLISSAALVFHANFCWLRS